MSEQQHHQETQPPETERTERTEPPEEARQPQETHRPEEVRQPQAGRAWVRGLAMFAGVVLIVVGIIQALEGLAAVINDKFYLATPNYIFEYDVTAWGWVHMLAGIVLAVAGYGILAGHLWGRVIGIIVALLSAVANFLFIPHYPVWSILLVTLDVAVIWALCVYSSFAEDA
jgi:hypothetical protein